MAVFLKNFAKICNFLKALYSPVYHPGLLARITTTIFCHPSESWDLPAAVEAAVSSPSLVIH
jgi:hypothetical protein